MEVIGSPKPCNEVDAEGLAIAVFKDEEDNNGLLKTLDAAVGGMITDVIESEEFTAKQGETAYFHVSSKSLKARRVLLIGCGERDSYKAGQITQMAGTATRFLRGKSIKTIAIAARAEGKGEKVAQTVAVGAVMGLFELDKYRTKDKEIRERRSVNVVIAGADNKEVQRGADRRRIIGESANFTRAPANEQGGHLTPADV